MGVRRDLVSRTVIVGVITGSCDIMMAAIGHSRRLQMQRERIDREQLGQ